MARGGEGRHAPLLLLLLSERESGAGSAAGSADEGERVEGEAGGGYRVACVAGAWWPRDERALTRSARARERARRAGARERRGGRPGRPERLGRKRGGGP